jgi:DNA replication protein DnaC
MSQDFSYLLRECKKCGGTGYIWKPGKVTKDGIKAEDPIQCECLKKMVMYTRLSKGNVLREYYDLSIDDFKTSGDKAAVKERVKEIVSDIDSFRNKGKSILFYGTRGTGKTMLAIEILKAAASKGHSIWFDFFPLVFEEFTRKGYKADETKERYKEIFNNVDFLVLDELFKEREYFSRNERDAASAKIFLEIDILKKRGNNPTILITNLKNGLEDIKVNYGQYVASMMSQNFEFINVLGEDYRENGKP